MKEACVLLASGFEEIEAVTIVDVLRRAEVQTCILSIEGIHVEGAHGMMLRADALISERSHVRWDAVILPGGMPGAVHLRDNEAVQHLVRVQHERQAWLGAICAAPIVLERAGVLTGRRATSYPTFHNQLHPGEY